MRLRRLNVSTASIAGPRSTLQRSDFFFVFAANSNITQFGYSKNILRKFNRHHGNRTALAIREVKCDYVYVLG